MTRQAQRRNTALLLLIIGCLAGSTLAGAAELTRCNAFDDAATTWAAVAAGSDRPPLPLRSLDPPVLLPDGSEFKTWEQPAEHRRTFFVAGSDPGRLGRQPGQRRAAVEDDRPCRGRCWSRATAWWSGRAFTASGSALPAAARGPGG